MPSKLKAKEWKQFCQNNSFAQHFSPQLKIFPSTNNKWKGSGGSFSIEKTQKTVEGDVFILVCVFFYTLFPKDSGFS
jgi:hypothetical protein